MHAKRNLIASELFLIVQFLLCLNAILIQSGVIVVVVAAVACLINNTTLAFISSQRRRRRFIRWNTQLEVSVQLFF
jgi:hypothetical protein